MGFISKAIITIQRMFGATVTSSPSSSPSSNKADEVQRKEMREQELRQIKMSLSSKLDQLSPYIVMAESRYAALQSNDLTMVPAAYKYHNFNYEATGIQGTIENLTTDTMDSEKGYIDSNITKLANELDGFLNDATSNVKYAQYYKHQMEMQYRSYPNYHTGRHSSDPIAADVWEAMRRYMETNPGAISSYGSENAYNYLYDVAVNGGGDLYNALVDEMTANYEVGQMGGYDHAGTEYDVDIPYV